MKSTYDFAFYAVLLTIVLVALDFVFLRFRKQLYERGKPLLARLLDSTLKLRVLSISRATEFLNKIKLQLSKVKFQRTAQANPKPVESVTELTSALQVSTFHSHPIESGASEQQSSTSQVYATESGTTPNGKTVHVQVSADVPVGVIVHITIQTVDDSASTTIRQEAGGAALVGNDTVQNKIKPPRPNWGVISVGRVWVRIKVWFDKLVGILKPKFARIDQTLFVAAAIIYLLAVSVGIDRFPIYFFTDEAVHANLASDLISRGFSGPDGSFLPTYFSLGPSFGLNGVSVYLQVIPTILFGKSIIVTRLVSALITLLAAILIGLLLKQVFKLKSYWLGILLLVTSPAWFLHARTAFEYMEVAAFFAATLYFYNRYRQGQDKFLLWTILSAALMFYTHGLGQVLAGLLGIFFFLSDFRYHFRPERRRMLLIALGLAILLFLPYLRYNLSNPTTIAAEIRQRGSYWTDGNFNFQEKIISFVKEYVFGLNPLFWFFPNSRDLSRHEMLGYGNILWVMLPFAGLGLVRAVMKFREPEYRTVLIALLIAPIPSAIVAIGTPRVIWMVIPWVILIAIGISWVGEWLVEKRKLMRFEVLNLAIFMVLALTSIYMLQDALRNGPTWYTDYGLYGMQYGAKQIFQDTVTPQLKQDPRTNFVISPTWANGTDQFSSFFLDKTLINRVRFGTPSDVVSSPSQFTPSTIFILTSDEFTNFSKDPRFKDLQVRQTIAYPNGKPGFYLITLKLADNIKQILAEENIVNRQPVEDKVTINGQVVRMLHSPIGSGSIQDSFDDNPDTLTRVLEANPYFFDLYPDPPLTTNSITIQTGALPDFTVKVSLYAPGAQEPVVYSKTYEDLPPDPVVTINFDQGPVKSARITIEIKDNTSGDTSQIHVRTIQFK